MPAPRRPWCPRAAAGAALPGAARLRARCGRRLGRSARRPTTRCRDRRADGCGLGASSPPARPPSSSAPSSGSARAAGGPARPRAGALLRARPAGRAAERWAGRAGPAGAKGAWGKELRLLFPFASCRVLTGTRPVLQAVGRRWARAPSSGSISRVDEGGGLSDLLFPGSWPLSIFGYRAPLSQRVPRGEEQPPVSAVNHDVPEPPAYKPLARRGFY